MLPLLVSQQSDWYACYTKPRFEKKVYFRLLDNDIETYLPLHKTLKQWSDRKKWVEEPLFRSYIFVRVKPKEIYKVQTVDGIVRFVSFDGKPVKMPEREIVQIKTLLQAKDLEIESTTENIAPGTKVEVQLGSLSGVTGELIEHCGKKKVIIRIETINHSMIVTLPSGYIAKAI